MTESIEIALRVARALEAVGVEYHLGGSLASSIHGEPRATNDVDLVVDLAPERVDALVAELGTDFAIDRESLIEAARSRASCNIFYLPLFTKIDLFVSPRGAFERSEMRRRRTVPVGAAGETLYVKSAEDVVLRKLVWFRDGGGHSEKQWRDVVQVLRLNRGALDERLLLEWADALGVAKLLVKARAEAARDDSAPGG